MPSELSSETSSTLSSEMPDTVPSITLNIMILQGHSILDDLARSLDGITLAYVEITPYRSRIDTIQNVIPSDTELSRLQFLVLCVSFVGVLNPSRDDLSWDQHNACPLTAEQLNASLSSVTTEEVIWLSLRNFSDAFVPGGRSDVKGVSTGHQSLKRMSV